MQTSSTLVVLCLFLAAASAFDLVALVNKLSTPPRAFLQSRSVEARQATECTFHYHCNAVDQPCDYDPSSTDECVACQEPFTACLLAAGGNQTAQCDCGVEALDCLRATGKYTCDSFIEGLLGTCQTFCELVNETARCGEAPSGIPTVEICGSSGNAYCTTEGTCAKAGYLGSSCDPAENIPASLSYVCAGAATSSSDIVCNASNICGVAPGSQYPNDGCSFDDECISGNCTNGLCLGLAAYETCIGFGDCDFGLYCAPNKTCLPVDPEGASCSLGSGNCAIGLICGSNNTCVPLFTGAVGDPCFTFQECAVGTTCNAVTHTCGTAFTPTTCVNDTDCSVAGTSCSCNPYSTSLYCQPTGFALPQVTLTQDCVDSYKSLIACTVANKCSQSNGDLPTSCSLQHCASEVDCLTSCTIASISTAPEAPPAECLNYGNVPCGPTTQSGTETGGTETGEDSAASIFAPVAALLVALLALFA